MAKKGEPRAGLKDRPDSKKRKKAVVTPKKGISVTPTDLRRRAELRLKGHKTKASPMRTDADNLRQLHELEVHQIELRMQNAELRNTRDALEAALETYTGLYDFAPVGYFSIDESGVILEANLTGASLLGVERSKLIGRSFLRFVFSASHPIILPFLKEVFSGFKDKACEAELQKAQGATFWAGVLISSAVGLKGTQKWCRIAFQDITSRRHAEDEIRMLNADLEERVMTRTAELQNANEELESFSYSVSHDLRAPLRHVMGFVNLLQEDAGPTLSETNRQHLATILEAAIRMETFIHEMLAFSRIGQSEMNTTEVNIDQLFQETVREFQEVTRERKIVWNVHALPPVHADRSLLRMVLVNLISNAVKFTGNRTVASIEIGCVPGDVTETVFYIRDNGAGFNPLYAVKLFGVFQRLHRQDEFEGTGIGLANVQRIIRRHGGRVWAEGMVDAGATFYFSLPKARPAGQGGTTFATAG